MRPWLFIPFVLAATMQGCGSSSMISPALYLVVVATQIDADMFQGRSPSVLSIMDLNRNRPLHPF